MPEQEATNYPFKKSEVTGRTTQPGESTPVGFFRGADLQRLSDQAKRSNYPLPLALEIFDHIRGKYTERVTNYDGTYTGLRLLDEALWKLSAADWKRIEQKATSQKDPQDVSSKTFQELEFDPATMDRAGEISKAFQISGGAAYTIQTFGVDFKNPRFDEAWLKPSPRLDRVIGKSALEVLWGEKLAGQDYPFPNLRLLLPGKQYEACLDHTSRVRAIIQQRQSRRELLENARDTGISAAATTVFYGLFKYGWADYLVTKQELADRADSIKKEITSNQVAEIQAEADLNTTEQDIVNAAGRDALQQDVVKLAQTIQKKEDLDQVIGSEEAALNAATDAYSVEDTSALPRSSQFKANMADAKIIVGTLGSMAGTLFTGVAVHFSVKEVLEDIRLRKNS